jgi:hypothetical protein
VLCDQPKQGIAKHLISGLDLRDALPENANIIATLDLESRFFADISEERFVATQQLPRNLKQQNLLWLMPPTLIKCVDPRSTQTISMWRVTRAILALLIFSLKTNPTSPSSQT